MTRITDFGRKRTYLEAGFGKIDTNDQVSVEPIVATDSVPVHDGDGPPPKKSRKRRKTGKINIKADNGGDAGDEVHSERKKQKALQRTKGKGKQWRGERKAATSEHRRLKRAAERHKNTTCLACRKQGHTVKDCPDAQTALYDDDAGNPGAPAKSVVGICYRCGSQKHNLSRCKKPADPTGSLPFASCFVCSSKGHLASSCPKNQGKGVYPNGGSCKICGQTSHLAKDCELRSQENMMKKTILLGSKYNEGGPDEDDFHVLKRRRDAVQQEEKILQKNAAAATALSNAKPKPKVVTFP